MEQKIFSTVNIIATMKNLIILVALVFAYIFKNEAHSNEASHCKIIKQKGIEQRALVVDEIKEVDQNLAANTAAIEVKLKTYDETVETDVGNIDLPEIQAILELEQKIRVGNEKREQLFSLLSSNSNLVDYGLYRLEAQRQELLTKIKALEKEVLANLNKKGAAAKEELIKLENRKSFFLFPQLKIVRDLLRQANGCR